MSHQYGSPGTEAGDRIVIGDPDGERTYPDQETRSHRAYEPTYTPETHERVVVGRSSPRLRGGPVLGGFVIGFATWILLELALFALDLGALAARVVPSADSVDLVVVRPCRGHRVPGRRPGRRRFAPHAQGR